MLAEELGVRKDLFDRQRSLGSSKCTELQHSNDVLIRAATPVQHTKDSSPELPYKELPAQDSRLAEGMGHRRPNKVASPSVPRSCSENGTGRSPSRCPAISPVAAQPKATGEGHFKSFVCGSHLFGQEAKLDSAQRQPPKTTFGGMPSSERQSAEKALCFNIPETDHMD